MPIPKRRPTGPRPVNENLTNSTVSEDFDTQHNNTDIEEENKDVHKFEEDTENCQNIPAYSDRHDNSCQEEGTGEIGERGNDEANFEEGMGTSAETASRDRKTHVICYSRRAQSEGYDFSDFTKEEQEITQWLYISEDAISDFISAHSRISDIKKNPDKKYYYNYGWGLPNDGQIYGYVYDCTKSTKRTSQFILQVLVTNSDIRKFIYNVSFTDPVNNAIKDSLGIKNNIFHQTGFENLKGRIVMMSTHNETMSNGKYFTKIDDIYFLDREDRNILIKMANTMLKQSCQGESD